MSLKQTKKLRIPKSCLKWHEVHNGVSKFTINTRRTFNPKIGLAKIHWKLLSGVIFKKWDNCRKQKANPIKLSMNNIFNQPKANPI
jgi:hypothetical protein